ncbi:MAG: sensor histidine kinase [Desulfamplus sp.]|nr:sensor histidine kinase [Desulfamplus sp.]
MIRNVLCLLLGTLMLGGFGFLPLPSVLHAMDIAPQLTVSLSEDTEFIDISGKTMFFEDPGRHLSIYDVSTPLLLRSFQVNQNPDLNFGFNTSGFWIRFSVRLDSGTDTSEYKVGMKNVSQADHDEYEVGIKHGSQADHDEYKVGIKNGIRFFYIEVASSFLDHVALYKPRGDGWTSVITGDGHPLATREIPHRNYLFQFKILPGETKTFYLYIQNQGSIQIPLHIWSPAGFVRQNAMENIGMGIFYGILAVMVLYNFILWVVLKDSTHLFFSSYILAWMGFQLAESGLGYHYVWRDLSLIQERASDTFTGVGGVCMAVMTQLFFNTRANFPRFHQCFSFFAWIFALYTVIVISSSLGRQYLEPALMVMLLECFVLLGFGLYQSYRHNSVAYWYSAGWFIFLVGMISFILMGMGFLPVNFFTRNAAQIGSVIQIVLLSLAALDRMRLERNRAKQFLVAKERAEAASAAKSSFLSIVSHELRTPLTSILGFAKLVRKKLDKVILPLITSEDKKVVRAASQVTTNLDIIIGEGERLTTLINDVLDLAKIEAGRIEWKMAPASIAHIVEKAVHSTSSLFESKPLILHVRLQENIPLVTCDHDRILQVFINLISNAVKFTEKGSVTVKVHQEERWLFHQVIDTGIGIAPENHSRVFEQFVQIEDTIADKPRGTGLGMPITKEIIEHHGGKIWIESTPGKGSVFAFTLPLGP